MKKLATVIACGALLAACSSSPSTETTAAPAASPTSSLSASQTAWVADVCSGVADLQTSITDLSTAATAGGDVKDSLTQQMSVIADAAQSLVTTVTTLPTGDATNPDAVAVQQAADAFKAEVPVLQSSVSDVADAGSVVASLKALPAVVTAASDALTTLGTTTKAVQTAAKNTRTSLGQAFAADPTCAALSQ